MNIRDIRYLIAVADTLHFGKAAKRCFVSQPTLSGQIRKLERELGILIFERTNRRVEVTPEGQKVLDHARQLLVHADAMVQVAETFRDPMAGPLRLGAIPTLSPYLMPRIWRESRSQYPQTKLVLTEAVHGQLHQKLKDRVIDAALMAVDVNDPELVTIPLFDEPFWLAHPTRHPIYNKDEITHDDLQGLDLLLLSEEHALYDQVLKVCSDKNGARQGAIGDLKAASMETLLRLVGSGLGCTLVPALSISGSWTTDAGIIARKLDLPDAYRRVSFVFHRRYHRRVALEMLAVLICDHLPNTVRVLFQE